MSIKRNRSSLDEMQVQARNKIGHQSFLMLAYLLMLDFGLNGFGIKWLDYPVNVYILFLVCMGSYVIRLLWAGAYQGPESKKRRINPSPLNDLN